MAVLDLRHENDRKGKVHYSLRINGINMVYCYIRKNACSSFKGMFLNESNFPNNKNENALSFMQRYHRASSEEIADADFRVCVLRSPEDRVASVFKNKFIQKKGNKDIFDNYERIVGEDPSKASFSDLVFKYLTNSKNNIDPHLFSQSSHLLPVEYNGAINMNDLYSSIVKIVGYEVADKYYLKVSNATSSMPTYHEISSDIPADKLSNRLVSEKIMPSNESLWTPKSLEVIRDFYADDYKLLNEVHW